MRNYPQPNHHPVNKEGLVFWIDYRNTGSVAPLGTQSDYSGNGYDMTLINNAFVDNQGGNFDGVADLMKNTSNTIFSGTDQFTVSICVNFNSFLNNIVVVDSSDSVNGFRITERAGGNIGFFIGNGTTIPQLATTDFALSTGVWYNITCTYDGSKMRVYKNCVASVNTQSQTGVITSPTNGIAIGSANSQAAFFGGKVDSVQIYKRVLSAGETCINHDKNKRG